MRQSERERERERWRWRRKERWAFGAAGTEGSPAEEQQFIPLSRWVVTLCRPNGRAGIFIPQRTLRPRFRGLARVCLCLCVCVCVCVCGGPVHRVAVLHTHTHTHTHTRAGPLAY